MISKWPMIGLFCTILFQAGILIYDGSVVAGQGELIKSMMKNKACMIDNDLLKSYNDRLNKPISNPDIYLYSGKGPKHLTAPSPNPLEGPAIREF